MATIRNSVEKERGCGRLPMKIEVCPCCHAGIKPSRGWTWVTMALFSGSTCANGDCGMCPLSIILPDEKVGLMWVGEKFYATPEAFTKEANAMGTSKRISQIPNDFVVGQTWVALAHRKGAPKEMPKHGQKQEEIEFIPAVFRIFKPQRIEYVVTGKETEVELDRLEGRGLSLVNVVRSEEQGIIDV